MAMDRVRTFLSNKALTLSLIAVILVIYPIELLTVIEYGLDTFQYWFVLKPGFEPTPAWLLALVTHGTVQHLGINLVGLVVYGLVLERYVSGKTYLVVYVSAGLLAGLIHTNLTQSTGAGASGAIMGVIGFYSIVYLALHRPDNWDNFNSNVRHLLAIFGLPVIGVQYAVDTYVLGGGYAHVAGGLVGIILGVIYVGYQVDRPISQTIESAGDSPFLTTLLMLVLAEAAVIVYLLIVTPENPATSTAVQAGATIILVLITVWYANQTRRNADLFRRELELETQRNHAETLQARTQKWLDDYPFVHETDVPAFVERDSMYAVPESLQEDPYFEDLKTNHTPDLQDSIDRLDDLYSEFLSIREDYIDSKNIDMYSEVRQIDVLEENYAKWLFERVLLLERTDKDKDDLKGAIEEAFENDAEEQDDYFRLFGDEDQFHRKPIMLYHYKRSSANNRKEPFMFRVYASGPKSHIENIESIAGYSEAVDAAELLDDIEDELKQLEKKLIEYNEAPRFEGECDLMLEID